MEKPELFDQRKEGQTMIKIFKDIQHTRKARHRVRIKDQKGEMKLIGYYALEKEADLVIKVLEKVDNLLFFQNQ